MPGSLSFSLDDDLESACIAGVDEAGRGPLAGNVVAAAVILPVDHGISGLNDSKALSPRRREVLFSEIQARALAWHVACATPAEIDALNILQASLLAMRRAVDGLNQTPEMVYVDGNRCPAWSYTSQAVVKGDSRIQSIAAASILAKVARDRELLALDARYPEYGFALHKGYPTAQHLAVLRRLGPCPEHRRSFRPVLDSISRNYL